MSLQTLDRQARRLLWAARSEICRHTGAQTMDSHLVGELYLKIRDTLARGPSDPAKLEPDTIHDLAVTMYLVAVAEAQADPALLADLKESLRNCLESSEEGKSSS